MKTTFSVIYYLKRQVVKKDGTVPVMGRITVDGSQTQFSCKLTVYKHLQEFLTIRYHVKDIALKELTPAFISDFEMFLRTDKHCCTNTVWLYVCPLRTMVFIAINNEWLTRDPFREYEIKKEETVRSFLTKDEIRLLMEGKLKNAKQELYRDLYLFCAFTGLSFADMRNLTEENIRIYFDEHEWININRQKGDSAVAGDSGQGVEEGGRTETVEVRTCRT